jgi:hypothetical protein
VVAAFLILTGTNATIPLTLARSLLERAGYSVRKSRARQERVIVARDALTLSLVLLNGCLAKERVAQLLEPTQGLPGFVVHAGKTKRELRSGRGSARL